MRRFTGFNREYETTNQMTNMPMLTFLPFAALEACVEDLTKDISTCLQSGIEKRGRAALAVSGGRTPEHLFPALASKHLAWDNVSITLTDERWVDSLHADSNEGLTRRLLLQGPASKARFVGLKTNHESPFDGLEDSETGLATLDWPLDVVFLGMGEDGHIASLFPGAGDWMEATDRAFPVAATASRQARMSLTPGALLDSRQIFLIITGPAKRATYEAALQPGPLGDLPVRLILHQDRVPLSVFAVD